MNTWSAEYLSTTLQRLRYYKQLAEKSFAQLSDTDLHFQPNPESNSIAILIRHMAGNMLSRWTDFLNSDGEKTWRQRDQEFEIRGGSREELLVLWEKGWEVFLDSLQSLQESDLLKTVYIRGEGLSVMDAIQRQLAHYPYHVGQIVFLAKFIRDHQWQTLSIARGQSSAFNQSEGIKDPAKKM